LDDAGKRVARKRKGPADETAGACSKKKKKSDGAAKV
jgi:hypothetical protein